MEEKLTEARLREMICRALEISPEKIMVLRADQENEIVTVVIDRGIKGCPKHKFTFGELLLMQLKQRTAQPAPSEDKPEPQELEEPAPPAEAKVKRGTGRK